MTDERTPEQELRALGCSDGYCDIAGKAAGMHTNGGCHCVRTNPNHARKALQLLRARAEKAERELAEYRAHFGSVEHGRNAFDQVKRERDEALREKAMNDGCWAALGDMRKERDKAREALATVEQAHTETFRMMTEARAQAAAMLAVVRRVHPNTSAASFKHAFAELRALDATDAGRDILAALAKAETALWAQVTACDDGDCVACDKRRAALAAIQALGLRGGA